MDIKTWAEENGQNGACECCGRRTWIESGCAARCEACDDCEPDRGCSLDRHRSQTLADLGMCEDDFR
jgi:hypothetical protein